MARNDGTPWSESDRQLLRELYPNEGNATLGKIFGRNPRSVGQKARAMGLSKSAEHMAAGPGQFRTGQAAWNKGIKGLDFGGHATRFKAGRRPETWAPIGSERECDGYLQRKVTDTGYTPRDWRPVHHLVWEEHTGRQVPEGHALVFRDGNRRNFTPDNLELITRAELMRRNSYHTNLPPELAQIVQLRGAITRKVNNRRRRHA
ncbi:HNH endonuclease [Halomonas sp. H33-56]|uniref:HNH endonuclease signature motif containing protein n=1 Tax=Halomonas sp. H33-56 TaxID=2950873 RepID=UPI0032DEDC1F